MPSSWSGYLGFMVAEGLECGFKAAIPADRLIEGTPLPDDAEQRDLMQRDLMQRDPSA